MPRGPKRRQHGRTIRVETIASSHNNDHHSVISKPFGTSASRVV